MWPADLPDGRPLASAWGRAAALVLACTAVAGVLLLAVPQWLLTGWHGVARPVREIAAACWFALALAACVALLVRLQRGRGAGDA